jgi:diguanylate cyclase (GGDEF)-like protein
MLNTYIVTSIINIISLIILSGLLYSDNILDNHRKKPLLYGITLTIIVILAEVVTVLSEAGIADLHVMNIICNVIGFALTPFIPIVLISIFDFRTLRKHLLLLIPTALNMIAAVLSPLFGLLFYIDRNNSYERGSIFPVFVIAYIVNILYLVVTTIHTGQKYLYPIKGKILALSLFTFAGTCVQLLVPSVYSTWHCVTLSLFLYYMILSEFEGSFDTLTRLYNRAAFEKDLKRLKTRKMFSVVAMDINNFKAINDTYGHKYGDTVLKKVAAIIRDSFIDRCTCYHISGDEFFVICRDANLEKLEQMLKSMTDKLTEERRNDNCLPTIAYGYSFFQGGNTPDIQKILKEADEQMYRFKQMQKA